MKREDNKWADGEGRGSGLAKPRKGGEMRRRRGEEGYKWTEECIVEVRSTEARGLGV